MQAQDILRACELVDEKRASFNSASAELRDAVAAREKLLVSITA
jgi:hypothetical protein